MILHVRHSPDNTGLLQDAGGCCMGPDNLGSVALDGVGEVCRALGAPLMRNVPTCWSQAHTLSPI